MQENQNEKSRRIKPTKCLLSNLNAKSVCPTTCPTCDLEMHLTEQSIWYITGDVYKRCDRWTLNRKGLLSKGCISHLKWSAAILMPVRFSVMVKMVKDSMPAESHSVLHFKFNKVNVSLTLLSLCDRSWNPAASCNKTMEGWSSHVTWLKATSVKKNRSEASISHRVKCSAPAFSCLGWKVRRAMQKCKERIAYMGVH